MKPPLICLLLGCLVMFWAGGQAQVKHESEGKHIPKRVLEGLKARFPLAGIERWTREKEGGNVVYDIEFKLGGKKFEADIAEDGLIRNWEKAIVTRELPAAVKETVEKKHPKSAMREIMLITAVKEGKDETEGYEIVLRTRDRKSIEVTVAPDGKIVEDSGREK